MGGTAKQSEMGQISSMGNHLRKEIDAHDAVIFIPGFINFINFINLMIMW